MSLPRKVRRSREVVPALRQVVIGGGIAGVCCAQELSRMGGDSCVVTLISSKEVLKQVEIGLLTVLLKNVS